MAVTIDRRFRGPSSSGNGGYTAALVADAIDADVVTVTLRQPPPLQVPLEIHENDDGVLLVHGDTTVAEGTADVAELAGVAAVGSDEARYVSAGYAGHDQHPFPECFVCGPERAAGDGLRLFPGRVGEDRTACVWTVGDDVAADARFVWAALDCPGGWSAPLEGRPMVLGRMTATVLNLPEAGEDCVVMGQLLGSEGRKTWTATTAYGTDGRALGHARAIWVALPPTKG